MAGTKLESEKVVIAAPMSFVGSAQRIWKMTDTDSTPLRVVAIIGAIFLIAFVWSLVLFWYMMFGLLLVPYRLLRRGSRKRKAEALRHRESLTQLAEMQRQQQMQTALLMQHAASRVPPPPRSGMSPPSLPPPTA